MLNYDISKNKVLSSRTLFQTLNIADFDFSVVNHHKCFQMIINVTSSSHLAATLCLQHTGCDTEHCVVCLQQLILFGIFQHLYSRPILLTPSVILTQSHLT